MSNNKFLSILFLGSTFVIYLVIGVVTVNLISGFGSTARDPAQGQVAESAAQLARAEEGEVLPATTGNQKAQIIMLKWKAGTGGGTTFIPANQADAATRFTPIRNYIRQQSYGRLTLDNVEIHGWLQTDIPYDNCGTTAWGNFSPSNPIDNWIAQNISTLRNDHAVRIIVMNTPCDSFPRYMDNNRRIRVGPAGFTIAKLEMALGNAFGSGRAAVFQNCPVNGVVANACGTPVWGGNMWEPMGNASQNLAGHNTNFSMWHRKEMGWVTPAEVRYVRNDAGPITIQAMTAAPGNLKTIEVCIGASRTYSIETRIKAGQDTIITDNSAFAGGIVWLTERIDNDGVFPSEGNYPPVDIYRMKGSWPPNSIFNDVSNGIKLTFGARNATTGAQNVTIDYTGTPPVNCPTEFSPPPPVTSTPTRTPTRTPTPAGGAELMTNTGFEADTNADGKPDSWVVNPAFTRTTEQKHAGAYSGKHYSATDATYTVGQFIPGIVGGRRYRFSGWINKPTAADSFSFDVYVVWRNGTTVVAEQQLFSHAGSTTGWVNKISPTNIQAPANANGASIQMRVLRLNSLLYVDDFSFRAI